MRSTRRSVSRTNVMRQATGSPRSARNVSPTTRVVVSAIGGMASLPSAAHSSGAGGTRRRARFSVLDGSLKSLPTKIAAPLPNPPAKKKSRRPLSGEAIRAAPSPRESISVSSSCQLKTVRWCPDGSSARGSALGAGAPGNGFRRGAQPRSATSANARRRSSAQTRRVTSTTQRRGDGAGHPALPRGDHACRATRGPCARSPDALHCQRS